MFHSWEKAGCEVCVLRSHDGIPAGMGINAKRHDFMSIMCTIPSRYCNSFRVTCKICLLNGVSIFICLLF